MKRKLSAAVFFAAVAMLGFGAPAGAVDGVIEINQAKVLAAGGYPYVISNPGSYRLTGNLTVSGINPDAIDVNASHVTIDLNGFSIIGPGSGRGIVGFVSGTSLTLENGTVTGFESGIGAGANSVVKSVRADSNLGVGILTAPNSVVQGCTANGNSSGISGGSGTVISGNTANSNFQGILCGSGCLVTGNTIDNNSSTPLQFDDTTSGYGGNVINGNGGLIIGKGTSLGAKNTNLCNGTAC
jgi:hypothetical protein